MGDEKKPEATCTEDSEPLRTLQMIWNYCPYCGRPIKVTALQRD